MKKTFFVYVLFGSLLFRAGGSAQEEKGTPSQKTKEAVEKFKKAPSAAGSGVEALKEAGKTKLQERLGGKKAAAARPAALFFGGKARPVPPAVPKTEGDRAGAGESLSVGAI